MGRSKTVQDDEVLQAAREIFRRNGHAASTRDIARAAGISQAVLYQRFGSKEEMFFRAMTPDVPDLDRLVGPYPPKDARADLLALSGRLLEILRAFSPTFLQVLTVPGVDVAKLEAWHARLPFFPILTAVAERFRRMEADGLIGAGNPRARAMTLLSAVHTIAFFESFVGVREVRRVEASVEAIVGVLWEGFAPGRKGAATRARGRSKS